MDKEACILEKTIRYLKYLQQEVEILEQQARKAELIAKKYDEGVDIDDRLSSSTEVKQPPVAVDARESGDNVLLRIHCENCKGILVKIIGEVEKLNLDVVHTSMLSIGSLSLDITITAEKEREFNSTVNEIVQSVSDVLRSTA